MDLESGAMAKRATHPGAKLSCSLAGLASRHAPPENFYDLKNEQVQRCSLRKVAARKNTSLKR